MRAIYTVFTLFGAGLCSLSLAETSQSVSLGVIKQTQVFELSEKAFDLMVYSPKLHYQAAHGPWLVGIIISKGDNEEQTTSFSNASRYKFHFDQHTESLYLDYSFEHIWLSIGYAQSTQKQTYDVNKNRNRSASSNESYYRSLMSSIGYGWYFAHSQLLSSISLTRQTSNEDSFLITPATNQALSQSNQTSTQQDGWLSGLNINYQYFIQANDQVTWILGAGVTYSRSIEGKTQLSQASRTRTSTTRFTHNNEEIITDNQSSSTSMTLQSGVNIGDMSIQLFADKLTSEDWRDALIEVSASVYF